MNEQGPLVSIISPAYNHEKFIADTIESVLAQTYTNWEMIIIDDGSTDGTFEIAKEYSGKYPQIKPFTQKNVGIFRLGESYNFALSLCRGEYIAILECDDYWFPNKLKVQVDMLQKNPQCVLSWGRAFLSSIDFKFDYYSAPQNIEDRNSFFNQPVGSFLEKFIFNTLIPALTIVIRKDILLKIGGFQQGFRLPLVDIPTTLELLMNGEFAFVDEPLGRWRIYPNQVTKTYSCQLSLGYRELVRSLMKRYPEVFSSQGLSEYRIEKYFRSKLVISYSRSGRYKLIRKDFKGARSDYWHSVINYGFSEPIWKIRSLVGIILSFFRLDVEWLAKLIGHKSYDVKS